VFIQTDNKKQIVDARLNGVSAQCTLESAGDIMMEIKAGLKIARNLAEGSGPDVVIVPMVTAIVDTNENVLTNDKLGFKNGFDTDIDKLFPVVEFELVVPSNGRAVISLTPTQ
jgi:hypothetical protein